MVNGNGTVIIGHSLAATENCAPFHDMPLPCQLILPTSWRSPGSHHTFLNHSTPPAKHTLPVTSLGYNSLFCYRGLEDLLDSLSPALVYLWEEPWSLAAWQMARWARSRKKPWLFFSAENRPKPLFWPFSKIRKHTFNESAGAIVPTREVAENLQSHGYAGKTYIVPLWVGSRPLLPSTNHPTIVFVGRLIALKQVDLIISALIYLPSIHLRIVGDGPEEKSLRHLANRLGVHNRVDFRGHVPNSEIGNSLANSALLILPTATTKYRAEQFGKSVLDAILCGLPVLVSETGHLSEWAKEFSTVQIVDCSSAKTLSQGIHTALNAPPAYETKVAMRKKAQELYGSEAAATHFQFVFTDTLSRTNQVSSHATL
jgi:glycosyltransferase involved in cell wall biosynthesis